MNSLTVNCDVHGTSPFHIVCDHLLNDYSTDWTAVEVNDGREVESDWVCPHCERAHRSGNDPIENLRVICMHCLRAHRESN